jgi:hypothetical protein
MNTSPDEIKLHSRYGIFSGTRCKIFSISDPRKKGGTKRAYSVLKYTEAEADKLAQEWFTQQKIEIAKWKAEKFAAQLQQAQDHVSTLSGGAPKLPFQPQPLKLPIPPKNNTHSWLLLGSTRSGKSTFLVHLYKQMFKGTHITCCQTMSTANEIYSELGKEVAVCPKYCPELVHDMYKINKETKNKYHFLQIIDDCPITKNDKELMKALCIYRNSNCSIVIANQELSMFNATARSNINYVCLFKLNSDMAIEKCVKTYLRSYFPAHMNLNEMIRAYREATTDHKFFLIDNLEGSVVLTKLQI